MFYNPVYLKRKGRFGLIWLAATQSRVLNKRELCSINVSVTCANILEHLPGYQSKSAEQRPRRFSLYLSSQLMYGSAKVLQKQWDYLFVDCSALIRKIHPEVSATYEIDLVITKSDPVTLESRVPTSIKDKYYDPMFGLPKESTVDVEALVETWDHMFVKKCQLSPSMLPRIVKPEIGSPHSVSDQKEIQIQEQEISPINPMLPGEQDLPILDMDNLALLDQTEGVQISVQEMVSPRIAQILTTDETSHIRDLDHLRTEVAGLDETPAVHTGGEMPGTPQKAKRKRRHGSPDGRKTKRIPGDREVDMTSDQEVTGQPDTAFPSVDTQGPAVTGADGQLISPVAQARQGHDWLQQNPPLQLAPVTPSPSPVRKRKPHKLIIDEKLQMTREEIKNNMLTHETTSVPLNLPVTHPGDWLKEPTSKALHRPPFSTAWRRNCVFGLRVYETETDSSDSFPSPGPLPPKRRSAKRRLDADETPQRPEKTLAELSVPSIERGRDYSAHSASLEGERSKSMVGHVSDDSLANVSGKAGQTAGMGPEQETAGGDRSEVAPALELEVLPPLLEEQEQLLSPVPLPPPTDLSVSHTEAEGRSPDMASPKDRDADTPRTQVLKMVRKTLRNKDDWTTFRTICPPTCTDRATAARMFSALCCQVGLENLCVRQEEPFSDIFIWLAVDRST